MMNDEGWEIQMVERDEIECDEIELIDYLFASVSLLDTGGGRSSTGTESLKDEDDEEENNEMEEEGLSKSGEGLKKLLGRTGALDDSDAEMEDDTSPVLAPKQKDAPKEEPVVDSPLKPASPGCARCTPMTSKSKGKRKTNRDDAKSSNNGAPPKKVRTEKKVKHLKEETVPPSKSRATAKVSQPSSSKAPSTSSSSGLVTEDEIRAVLMQKTPVTTHDLVAKFKSRLESKEDKDAFAAILKRICRIQKTNGPNYRNDFGMSHHVFEDSSPRHSVIWLANQPLQQRSAGRKSNSMGSACMHVVSRGLHP
ncbi:hypothetical protein Vadar_000064 [Vaccinium darrowii]|uniref:Uncharacterized protein n=1 Tax=Vaccinium darrowii TaxID=229202 RepID=A0ACB7YRL8_9ERIC|nr:hypothetical protein Vadar_000064 [Vaccinium darrowii]